MEILLTNVGRDPIEIDAQDWDLTRYRDAHRASDFRIKCSRKVPITKYARVVAKEDKTVLFRGYIQKPKLKNIRERELNCKGDEDLLLRRFTGRFSFNAGDKRLVHAFQSDAPNQEADIYDVTENVGLLFMANSMIPYHGNVFPVASIETRDPTVNDDTDAGFNLNEFMFFYNRTTQVMWKTTDVTADHAVWAEYENPSRYNWIAHGHGWIYCLPGLGSASRIGTTANIYAEGKLLPRVEDYETLESTDISCYSDTNDLWLRLDDIENYWGFGPRMPIFAENIYDTGVRMGTIDNPDTVLAGNLQLNFDRILDSPIDLAEFHGLEPQFRYGSDYTYLDALEDPVENEFILPEEHIQDISQSIGTDLRPHALIGLGVGSRDVQHVYTVADHTWMGTWYDATYEVEDGYIDPYGKLKPTVEAEYARLQNDEVYTVKPSEAWSHAPKPNDLVILRLVGESEKSLQVASCKRNMKGDIEFELGGRKNDILDAFNAKSSLSKVYSKEYLTPAMDPKTYSGTCKMGDITHGWCTGVDFSNIIIPASVFQSDGSHRVTVDISISSDYPAQSMWVAMKVGNNQHLLCFPSHYMMGDSLSKIDITGLVVYGTYPTNTISIWVRKKGEWDGASCSAHPDATVSITVNGWKRTPLA